MAHAGWIIDPGPGLVAARSTVASEHLAPYAG
jgi:hypothetical protein